MPNMPVSMELLQAMGQPIQQVGGPNNNAVAPVPMMPQITPQIARRFQKRLENAGSDDELARVIRDAAKYGVDWSMHGPR